MGRGEGPPPTFFLLLFVSRPDALDAWCGRLSGLWVSGCYDFCWECVMMMMVGDVFFC